MKKTILYGSLTCFLLSLCIYSTSCNPHRRGYTSRQIGAGGGVKRHYKPASAKRARVKKY